MADILLCSADAENLRFVVPALEDSGMVTVEPDSNPSPVPLSLSL